MAGKWAHAAGTCTRVGRVAVIRTFSSKQAQVKQCGPGAGQEHAGLAEAEGRGLIAEKACAGFLKLSSRVGGPSSALGSRRDAVVDLSVRPPPAPLKGVVGGHVLRMRLAGDGSQSAGVAE